jgi:hypothetical protein
MDNARVPSKPESLRAAYLEVQVSGGSVMTVVLLLCAVASTVIGALFTQRRRRQLAWDRELEAAFASGRRPRGATPP